MSDIPVVGVFALVLLVVVMLGFALGTQRNIRRGNDLLRWLQAGLPLLGKRTSFRWLGSTAAVMRINRAEEPFREAEVVVVMAPRDVALMWFWARRRGRRDFLILRGWLRRAPRFEVEAGDDRGWTGTERLRRLDWEEWQEADWGDEHLRVAHSGDADVSAVRRAWGDIASAGGPLWRLSVRRDSPHLEVHLLPPDTEAVSADRLFQAFRSLGHTAIRPA